MLEFKYKYFTCTVHLAGFNPSVDAYPTFTRWIFFALSSPSIHVSVLDRDDRNSENKKTSQT